jgi:hypothetical protein
VILLNKETKRILTIKQPIGVESCLITHGISKRYDYQKFCLPLDVHSCPCRQED